MISDFWDNDRVYGKIIYKLRGYSMTWKHPTLLNCVKTRVV